MLQNEYSGINGQCKLLLLLILLCLIGGDVEKAIPLLHFWILPAKKSTRGKHVSPKLMRLWVKSIYLDSPRPCVTVSNWDLEGNRYKLVRPLDQRCITCREHSLRRCPLMCSSKLSMYLSGFALIYEDNNSSVFLLARSCTWAINTSALIKHFPSWHLSPP